MPEDTGYGSGRTKLLYDISKEQRGREHFHVKEYQAPEIKFVDVNTTEDDPSQSLDKIKDYNIFILVK